MRVLQFRFGFIAALVFMLTLSACGNVDSQPTGSSGEAADFMLESASGGKISLSNELKSKKAVMVFFATWCPACMKEAPAVNAFYLANKDKISVFGINVQESKAKVESFIARKGISYPIALDSDGSVSGLYGIRGIPTVIAVDKDGSILYRGHSIEEMEKRVEL